MCIVASLYATYSEKHCCMLRCYFALSAGVAFPIQSCSVRATGVATMEELQFRESFLQWQAPDGIDAIMALYRKSPSAGDVFSTLLKLMGEENTCYATQAELGEVIGKSRDTVIRAIRFLELHQYIFVLKTARENMYTLSPKIVWRGNSGERKLHANINCNVLLRLEPQSKIIKDHAIIENADT